ncbi:multidrug efflux SMR transporter [Cellulomonas sp. zg-ZUI222]|uniref:Multidrug efflux SMR transporter n=1 Tax=Cellulomonas wangleii TaxID=2816956 RepID=A0ABX8D509_9CELL|nr:multidrug efflux SMR transporter [Cellulomonas sp. zg-ZUI22]MBO0919294.1 multidrug efflux SMR transporter [Cellulomonas wangleii]MBO0924560.1 multidrug efflux SMR transporter [Cellulomonas wangleii]QVI62543.1 multidrug efflux SMR transporter [Cellulomonas wangleii]
MGPGPTHRTGPRTRGAVPGERQDGSRRRSAVSTTSVAWIVLVVSGLFEAVWATALGRSEGFTRLGPTVVFGLGLLVSMGGLAYAMRELPTGTSYAVWVGIGASVTVAFAMVTGAEPASLVKILLILGIVGCVIGLKLVH